MPSQLKYGGGSMMLRGCFAAREVGACHKKEESKLFGNIKATSQDMEKWMNSDPKHTTRLATKWLRDNKDIVYFEKVFWGVIFYKLYSDQFCQK